MSDACYEFFEANIESARAFTRKTLTNIAKLNTGQEFIFLLISTYRHYTITNNLVKQILNGKSRRSPKMRKVSVDVAKKNLRKGLDILKEVARDHTKIREDFTRITQKWPFGRFLFNIILRKLFDKFEENIEDLYLVIESALEEEGEYVTAEELLASLS